jgi:hypothetical protein
MPAQIAKRDENYTPTIIGVDSVNYTLPTTVAVDPSTHEMLVQGNVKTLNTLITKAYDYISVAYPDTSTEVYTFKTGGAGGTTVGTITVVYTDAVTKLVLSTVTKT